MKSRGPNFFAPFAAQFLRASIVIPILLLSSLASADDRPNVLLIMTDDQGYGDFGFHGNPKIKTPRLDALAAESAEFTQFCVSPVCTPTRASLMTGRYNYRTAAIDTYKGRAMMRPDETTIAEILSAAGYRTGIVGKWHLGDCYPLRAMDQGFEEALVHRGGGIGQASDPAGGESYFDTILQKNGEPTKVKGYCSDVFADAAMDFLARHRDEPFFLYLAFNAPHTPLEVPPDDLALYDSAKLAATDFPAIGNAPDPKLDPQVVAKVYAMITNADRNIGRVLDKLGELGLEKRTIVVFLDDNGPQQPRFNAGLRGTKGTTYEGGIRAPCLVRWPGRVEAGKKIDRLAAHIDLAPTILEICGVAKPEGAALDGRSLWPLLAGGATDWPDRTLYFQWHRGDAPQARRAFAARSQRFKLVQAEGREEAARPFEPKFELFDLAADPFETRDLTKEKPDILKSMLDGYDAWFRDVSSRGYDVPRIVVGSAEENPSTLTMNDMRGPDSGHSPRNHGWWDIEIAEAGLYEIALVFYPSKSEAPFAARLQIQDADLREQLPAGTPRLAFNPLRLAKGPARLGALIESGGKPGGPRFVEVKRLE